MQYNVVQVKRMLQPRRASHSLVGDMSDWVCPKVTPNLPHLVTADTLPCLHIDTLSN